MRAWMVRSGRSGEREQDALTEGFALAGWPEVGDLSNCRSRADLRAVLNETYVGRSPSVLANWTGQLWRFVKEIQAGDFVVMPLKGEPAIAIGRVSGDYLYRSTARIDLRHARPVEWIRAEVPRASVMRDLLYTLGSLLTVCQLKRNGAMRRIAALAESGSDPGPLATDLDAGTPLQTPFDLLERAAAADPKTPVTMTVSELVGAWGAARRTPRVIATIEADLAGYGLETQPGFTSGWVGNTVLIVPVPEDAASVAGATADVNGIDEVDPTTSLHLLTADEPGGEPPLTLRLGNLIEHEGVTSVHPGDTIALAVTLMLKHNYSQLAVVDADNHLEGVVSWESIAQARLASSVEKVADATKPALECSADEDALGRIAEIFARGFIFVRKPGTTKLSGIVTAADLTLRFGDMARPIIRIEEIERRLRRRADEVFTVEEMRTASKNHKVAKAADLTFGNYVYLLNEPTRFAQTGWPLDWKSFLDLLRAVRDIRNELMHFSPDPLTAGEEDDILGLLTMLRTVDPRP